MFFEPIVQIGFDRFVTTGDKALRGAVHEEAFDFGAIWIEFAFPRSTRSS
jgi:hypothetical protein